MAYQKWRVNVLANISIRQLANILLDVVVLFTFIQALTLCCVHLVYV